MKQRSRRNNEPQGNCASFAANDEKPHVASLSPMLLHCLGTTGFHPSPSRHTACYYLAEIGLALDAGSGMFRMITMLIAEPRKDLTILLSHAHLDHIVGLTFLIDVVAATELERVKVIGEPRKLAAIEEHLFQEQIFPVKSEWLEFMPLESNSGARDMGAFQLEWYPLEHPGGSLGYNLTIGDKKLCYVTDTIAKPNADYLPQILNADLLLHECYFKDDQQSFAEKTGHSCLTAVLDVIRSVRPKRSALIHMNPLAEILGEDLKLTSELQNELGVCIAEDEMEIEF